VDKLNESAISLGPGMAISEDDFNVEDYIFVCKHLKSGTAALAKCVEKYSGKDIITAIIACICYYILADNSKTAGELAYILEGGYYGLPIPKAELSDILNKIASNPGIARKLEEIKVIAAEEMKKADEKAMATIESRIKIRKTGRTDHYRIISKDMRYEKGCAAYIVFLRPKSPGLYKMGIDGVPRKLGNYSEPVFESVEQARDFIIAAADHMETKKPVKDFEFTITDDQFRGIGPIAIPDFGNLKDCYDLVNTDCGPAYINKRCKCHEGLIKGSKSMRRDFSDALIEDTEEMPSANAVAKHTTLNPKLWTADEVLKPEVEEKIKQIVDVFLAGLAEDEIKINVKDILIIGSNASYNYTPYSDLDLHIIVDTDSLECPDNLYSKLYSAYRSLFNKRLDIDFYDIPVEIYVEDESTPRVSNGVYSVLNREWLQEPKYVNIPDMDMDVFNAELAKWEERYRQVLNDAVGELEEYYEPDPDAAEDIKTQQIREIDAYIEDLYNLRKIGLPLTGEYGLENVIFKTIRNKGYLDRLKDLKNELLGKELSLSEMVDQLGNNEPEELPEGLDMLSNKQITEYRIKIAQLAHTQPLINPYGKFTISNVSENDADYICRMLKAQDYIANVNKTAGKFDFKAMATTGMPNRMYNISGQIKI